MSLTLSGIGVSRGIAIGRTHLLQRDTLEISEYSIPPKQVTREVKRFQSAITVARRQLRAVRKRIPKSTRADIAAFIDTHLLMMEDTTLTAAPVELIRGQQCNAEWALKQQRDALVQVFEEMDDPYLRTRKDDIDHVVNRILRILLQRDTESMHGVEDHLHGRIILADDLTPADTVLMQHQGIAAFVTEYGAPVSHTAILARSLGIPAVVGVRNVQHYVRDDELIIVDGRQGVIIAAPDELILDYYQLRQQDEARYRKSLARLKGKPAITRDGSVIHLQANIELPEDVEAVRQSGAQGVGLYRTEFLFMNREDMPSEEEQLERYLEMLTSLQGLPLTIRTLDLGADKEVDGGPASGRISANPALGLRAIRLCLQDLSLFRPQLRAILRASAHGPVRMMVPMLSNCHEVRQVKSLLEELRQELASEGLDFDEHMPVGGMIEVPAAALAANFFARALDFMSIGTNDLIQYTLAIDRIDDEVNYLYDPLHPAVLQLIHTVIEAGRKADTPVAMCGEMAGDTRYTRLLLGLGLREFSMQPASLLEVKRIINDCEAEPLAGKVRKLLRTQTLDRRDALLAELINGEA